MEGARGGYQLGRVLSVADAITNVASERASGWIMKSLALRGLDRTQEAFDVLFANPGHCL
jgi:hypothetical protein